MIVRSYFVLNRQIVAFQVSHYSINLQEEIAQRNWLSSILNYMLELSISRMNACFVYVSIQHEMAFLNTVVNRM